MLVIRSRDQFVAVYRGTGTQLRDQIDKEIAGDAGDLAHDVELAGVRAPRRSAEEANQYVRDQPFAASSTVLFALVAGAATSTNRPELLPHAGPDHGETAAEQANENRQSRKLLTAGVGYSTLALPDVGDMRVLKRAVRVRGGLLEHSGVGVPLAAVTHGAVRA